MDIFFWLSYITLLALRYGEDSFRLRANMKPGPEDQPSISGGTVARRHGDLSSVENVHRHALRRTFDGCQAAPYNVLSRGGGQADVICRRPGARIRFGLHLRSNEGPARHHFRFHAPA
jgi:hypothetical protein